MEGWGVVTDIILSSSQLSLFLGEEGVGAGLGIWRRISDQTSLIRLSHRPLFLSPVPHVPSSMG